MKKYIEQNNIKVSVNFLQLHDLVPGSSVVMVGPYGSGKTTACQTILDQVKLQDMLYTLVISSNETVLLNYRDKYPEINTLLCEGDIDTDTVSTYLREPRGVVIVDDLDLRRWNIASKIEKLLAKPTKTVVIACQEVTSLPSKILDYFSYYMLFHTKSISDLTMLYKCFFTRKHRWVFPSLNLMTECMDRVAVDYDILIVDTTNPNNRQQVYWTNARSASSFNSIVNQMIRKSHMLEPVETATALPGQVLIIGEEKKKEEITENKKNKEEKIDINTAYVDTLTSYEVVPEEKDNQGMCVIL